MNCSKSFTSPPQLILAIHGLTMISSLNTHFPLSFLVFTFFGGGWGGGAKNIFCFVDLLWHGTSIHIYTVLVQYCSFDWTVALSAPVVMQYEFCETSNTLTNKLAIIIIKLRTLLHHYTTAVQFMMKTIHGYYTE